MLALIVGMVWLQMPVHADRGVGVSLGSISIDEVLRPGGSYGLPVLGVLNSGDEASEYLVTVSYDEQQAGAGAAT